MAVKVLTLADSQTWIYPPQTYTGYDGIYKKKNHWYNGHSVMSRRGKRLYQAGNSAVDGNFNGNMMSFFFFKNGSQTMRQFVQSIGGSGKITKIVLKVTCGYSWYSSMNMRVCLSPYWNTTNKWGQGGYWEATADNYDTLGIKHLTTVSIPKGSRKEINLTQWKHMFDTYETINIYIPGAYNKDYGGYGWIYGHIESGSNIPQLEIHYNTNSAPHAPTIRLNTQGDSHGYIKPELDFNIISNGDPDNNLHSAPYAYQLFDQNGNMFRDWGWFAGNHHQYDLSSHRAQTVKLRARIRDAEGLVSYTDKNLYVNKEPYWSGLGANSVNISFSSGVTNGVFKDNITLRWPAASDSQKQHANNLRYSIYCQKGTDKGPSADGGSNRIAQGLTGTSYTVNATNMPNISVAKGERIYFSVWVTDGLEWSTYRLTSSWIYRDKPPTTPTNVAPTGGHYEKSVQVSWSKSSGANGTTIEAYKVSLIDKNNSVVTNYTTKNTSLTCSDLGRISRGDNFKFKVVAIDNFGNESSAAYSGTCRRNGAPSNPKNFKINSNTIYFKESIPLSWTASVDPDGDAIKYNIYFNVNNGAYQSLALGITSTSYNHNISSFSEGTQFNYYIEAYDTFNVYSSKVYINTRPEVNTPPKPPSILLPFSNRELYVKSPRIIFRAGDKTNSNALEVIAKINGKVYRSKTNGELFSKSTYNQNEEGMFIVPNDAPLNFSKRNEIIFKTYDGLDYSQEVAINIPVVSLIYNKINDNEDRFIDNSLKDIREMISANRFAYALPTIVWKEEHILKKSFYDELGDSIHELVNFLNSKATSNNVKRNHNKNIISKNEIIHKKYVNNILDMIEKS